VTFRLLTYNIWKGGAGRVDQLATVIERCRPDVALLQEATRPDVVGALAERTGMPVWRSFARQSLAYLSRRPIAHDQWHRPRFSRHAFIEVVPADVPVRLFGLHLSAVHAAWTERRRVLELGSLLRAIAAHQRGFHLLAGDFNTLAPGAVLEMNRLPPRYRPFVWLSGGRIKWRTIQTVIDAGYCDAFRILHAEDPGMTMPSWDPHVRLDYVFVPQAFRERLVSCEVVTGGEVMRASDHLPVVADFHLP
jgi:endonuclease/exonuclease/phosphatase family metal-dependent hydrolase